MGGEQVGEAVEVRRDDLNPAVVVLTLARPRQANALNGALARDLLAAVDALAVRDDWDVLVVTGSGKHFCGGADLRDRDLSPAWLRNVRAAFDHLAELRRPTIAAINGAAMGGGCELALSCDLRVLDADALIGVPEIKIGALAVAGGTQRLPRAVGSAKALELLYTGEPVDAAEALRIGLVNRLASPGHALEEAIDLARLIASRSRPALELAKFLTRTAWDLPLSEGLRIEVRASEPLMAGVTDSLQRTAGVDPLYSRIAGG